MLYSPLLIIFLYAHKLNNIKILAIETTVKTIIHTSKQHRRKKNKFNNINIFAIYIKLSEPVKKVVKTIIHTSTQHYKFNNIKIFDIYIKLPEA